MRRLFLLLGVCLLSGCATFGSQGEAGRKYVVFFTRGSARIGSTAGMVIAHAAQVAARHPDAQVMVAGFAAAHGNLDADQALSGQRAEAVAAALQADGVAPARIVERPRPPSNEDPGVAAHRVEISLSGH